jgi:hypothetical protein
MRSGWLVGHTAEGAPTEGKRWIVSGWRSPPSRKERDNKALVFARNAASFMTERTRPPGHSTRSAATRLKTAMPGWQALLFE